MDALTVSDQKKRQLVAVAKVGGGLAVGLAVSSVVFVALQGILGLIAVGVVSLVMWNAWPVLVDGLADMKIKGIKFIATKNPIETLELDLEKRQAALQRFHESIVVFGAAVLNFQDKLSTFKKSDPDYAVFLEDNLIKMKKLLELRKKKYKDAEIATDKYSDQIEQAKGRWEMGLEAAKMNKAAGIIDGKDFMNKLKSDTAFESVSTSLNMAFSEMETSLLETSDEKDFSIAALKSNN